MWVDIDTMWFDDDDGRGVFLESGQMKTGWKAVPSCLLIDSIPRISVQLPDKYSGDTMIATFVIVKLISVTRKSDPRAINSIRSAPHRLDLIFFLNANVI